jgi:uncharacterized lipoprotein YmbA
MRFTAFDLLPLLAAVVLLASGCATTPPSEFYHLTAMEQTATSATGSRTTLSVGVGPVQIPEYIDRPQIVLRTSRNQLSLDEFHRWAGGLRDEIKRVLAQNLSRLLNSEDVASYPWDYPFDPAYQVYIDIRQLDGSLGGEVRLDARWIISGRSEGQSGMLYSRQTLISEAVDSAGYMALVAAESRALETLSREIAEQISRLHSATDK